MNISLRNQNAVIVGGANGIGWAITKAFLEADATVTVLDRDTEALDRIQRERSERIETFEVDITNEFELRQAAEKFTVDHLVCAAAIGSGKTGFPFWKMNPEDWHRVIDVTLMGTVHTLHAFAPCLLEGDTSRKSVLLLSSVAGQIGSQTDPPYSACKAAVINFAQVAAKDFAPYGVRVNVLSPGMVKTDLNESVYEASEESSSQTYEEWAAEKIERIAPLGRWQEVEEFGAMAVFLASEKGRNITGQTLNIDGGQVMHS
ncbi:MAG: SDR family oxidoreductase [Verrucomicrobiota bacterium]